MAAAGRPGSAGPPQTPPHLLNRSTLYSISCWASNTAIFACSASPISCLCPPKLPQVPQQLCTARGRQICKRVRAEGGCLLSCSLAVSDLWLSLADQPPAPTPLPITDKGTETCLDTHWQRLPLSLRLPPGGEPIALMIILARALKWPIFIFAVLLLYWSVVYVSLTGHLKWLKFKGKRNDVLAW